MATLLLRWLNEGLVLSREVTSFEKDFVNGYLLGEVLYKFNQQPDFSQFIDDDKSDSIVSNFCRVEPSLRRLRVKFDSKVAYKIMKGERGVASALLYQIKMAIDGLGGKPVGRVKPGQVSALAAQTARSTKPSFDKSTAAFFEKSLRILATNQNDLYLKKHLSRFEEEAARQRKFAESGDDGDRAELRSRNDRIRQQRLHATRREHEILAEAEERGIREWQRNQEIRLAQGRTQALVKAQQREMAATRAAVARDADRRSVEDGIGEFEATLRERHGIEARKAGERPTEGFGSDPRTYLEFVEELENKLGDSASREAEAQEFLARVRHRKAALKSATAERAKRRRAFLVRGLDDHKARLREDRDAATREMLLKRTAVENELGVDLDIIARHRKVFEEDAAFRSVQVNAARRRDRDEALRRDADIYSAICARHERDVSLQVDRVAAASARRAAIHHRRAEDLSREVVLKIVDAAIVIARQREISCRPAPAQLAAEIGTIFASPLDMSTAVPVPPRLIAEEPAEGGWTGVDLAEVEAAAAEAAAAPPAAPDADGDSKDAELPVLAPIIATAGVVGAEEDGKEAAAAAAAAAGQASGYLAGDAEGLGVPLDALEAAARLDSAALADYITASGAWADPASGDTGDEKEGAEGGEGDAEADGEAAAGDEDGKVDDTPKPDPDAKWRLAQIATAVGNIVRPPAAPEAPPDVPTFPARVCILGPPLSGKTTQAERLAERHRLRLLNPDALLREALALVSTDGSPLQRSASASTMETISRPASPTQDAGFANDQVRSAWEEEATALGSRAMEALRRGDEVGDDVYVGLIVAAIRAMRSSVPASAGVAGAGSAGDDAGAEAKDSSAEEASAEDAATGEEAAGESKAEGEAKVSGDAAAADAEASVEVSAETKVSDADADATEGKGTEDAAPSAAVGNSESTRAPDGGEAEVDGDAQLGWILDGFPRTVRQARLLERALTGFSDPPPHTADDHERWAAGLAPQREVHPDPESVPQPSGVDVALYLDLDSGCVIRRGLGRRMDPETGQLFHIDHHPPPEDAVMKHRLEVVRDDDNLPGTLADHVEAYSAAVEPVLEWFKRGRSGEAPLQHVSCATVVAGDAGVADVAPPDDVFERLDRALGEALAAKRERDSAADEARRAAEAAEAEAAAADAAVAARLQAAKDAVTAAQAELAAAEEAGENGEEGAEEREEAAEAALEKAKAELVEATPAPPPVVDDGSLPPLADADVAGAVDARWREGVSEYGTAAERALRCLRVERQAAIVRLAVARRRFTQALRRPAPHMQAVLEALQASINAVDEDMRFSEAAKAEMHARLADASGKLFAAVEAREAASAAQLKALRENKWVADAQASVLAHHAALMQAEVDAFTAAWHVALEYYHVASGGVGPPPVADDEFSVEAFGDDVDPEVAAALGVGAPGASWEVAGFAAAPVDEAAAGKGKGKGKGKDKGKGKEEEPEDDGSGVPPTLAAALSKGAAVVTRALRRVDAMAASRAEGLAARREAEAEAKAAAEAAEAEAKAAKEKGKGKKGKKGGKAAKKGGKDKKKGKGDDDVALPFVALHDQAFSVLRHLAVQLQDRLGRIRRVGEDAALELRSVADEAWGALQAGADERFEAEAAAVGGAVRHVAAAIEAEQPLPYRLRLEGAAFVVDRAERVLPAPAEPVVRATERRDAEGLVLAPSQLRTLSHALRASTAGSSGTGGVVGAADGPTGVLLPRDAFVGVIRRLSAASKLPAAWGGLSTAVLARFADAFDVARVGLVDWRAAVNALSRSTLAIATAPTRADLLRIRSEFAATDASGAGRIAPEAYAAVRLWFEPKSPPALEGVSHAGREAAAAREDARIALRGALLDAWCDADGLLDYRRALLYWAADQEARGRVEAGLERAFAVVNASGKAEVSAEEIPVVFDAARGLAAAAVAAERARVDADAAALRVEHLRGSADAGAQAAVSSPAFALLDAYKLLAA